MGLEILTIEKEEQKVSVREIIETNERQTIVHCKHHLNPGDGIRIWKTTFLLTNPGKSKLKLLHAERITMYPHWTIANKSGWYHFTLYFAGLPKGVTTFDLFEDIPQPNGFIVKNIQRNKTDVYNVIIG